ncbi:MAG: ATP-binding protein, partial [Chloroflexi bacterium]|nr:ATP-binding protein [Chloroflexota bacterium]
MLGCALSCAIVGLDGAVIQVEVDVLPGLPNMTVVGLPDDAVREARERVRSAVRNSGCEFPMKRVTVNLAPADLKKEGVSYDLPIALGVIASTGQAPQPPRDAIFIGELSLDGTLRPTTGVLPMAAAARDHGLSTVFVPTVNAPEAALVEGVTVMPVRTLAELLAHLRGEKQIEPVPNRPVGSMVAGSTLGPDIADVRGQEHAKRA